MKPSINYRGNYRKLSGGFPHSDIHGSKPVPGSPWLNAGYHVLHRLLLPRHPPNALFALDLIQKKKTSSGQKRYIPDDRLDHHLVSVLDLDSIMLGCIRSGSGLTWPASMTLMF